MGRDMKRDDLGMKMGWLEFKGQRVTLMLVRGEHHGVIADMVLDHLGGLLLAEMDDGTVIPGSAVVKLTQH